MQRRTSSWGLASLVSILLLLTATACSSDDDSSSDSDDSGGEESGSGSGSVLDEVVDRDVLNCGVNNSVPGFGFQTEEGTFEGFDIDYCKAVAAAVLGDPEKVEYIALTPEQRFTSLESGEVDVLARNTTWTSTRDGANGAAFVTTTFYDGQAIMVPSDAGITSIDQLTDATICLTA